MKMFQIPILKLSVSVRTNKGDLKMSAFISVFDKDSEEYEKLQIAALMLTNRSAKHYKYYVGKTDFDSGQNWEWTTILSNGGNWGGFQAL